MKITHFIEKMPRFYCQHATVEVTTGFWKWKQTVTRPIVRIGYTSIWAFEDTGEFVPQREMDKLQLDKS